MSLKKHSLYNFNWSFFEHAVACANKPGRVVLQLYVYLKLLRNQYWVNLLSSVSQNSILNSILDRLSLFSILYLLYMWLPGVGKTKQNQWSIKQCITKAKAIFKTLFQTS